MTATNPWCETLGIKPPVLEDVVDHREANTYALLLVALLERGEPMTLEEVAVRLEVAGVASRQRALLSLKRCRPARPPAYRDGDRYHLDPHDKELQLWVFRLGLRPPRIPATNPVEATIATEPLPGPDVALTSDELDEAWNDASLSNWSAQRLALAVLDAHGSPLPAADVVAAVAGRTRWFRLDADSKKFKRRNSAINLLPDDHWAIRADAGTTLEQARTAVRERIAAARRAPKRTSPEELARHRERWERERAARGAELARRPRALLVAFPPKKPEAVALLDVKAREITTFVGADELATVRAKLESYDILGAMDVRALLRALDFDPGARRLAELGPPQKSMKINQRGRRLKITTAMLVQGSCGISRPFGDPKKMKSYLASDALTKLGRRLEADAKSLYALYEYGRLHGRVRLRWGFLDEVLPAPWADRDESRLYDIAKTALEAELPIEIVVGNAPGWEDPWSRVQLAYAHPDPSGWGHGHRGRRGLRGGAGRDPAGAAQGDGALSPGCHPKSTPTRSVTDRPTGSTR